MAVLRSGKNTKDSTRCLIKKRKNKRFNDMFLQYGIKECSVKLNRINTSNLKSLKPINNKKIVTIYQPNVIWNELITHSYVLGPGAIVLAKMIKYRPWPARINTMYKVGDIYKCYVLFYGTYQIGSVLMSQCVSFSSCSFYLSLELKQLKVKFKWNIDYEKIAELNNDDRAYKIIKLTQVQKFFLAIRDVERIHGIEYSQSMINIA